MTLRCTDVMATQLDITDRQAPDPTEIVYRGCPDCRVDVGLPERHGAPGQWYWCASCPNGGDEWQEPGQRHDPHRPTPLGFTFVGLWIIYALGLLLVMSISVALWLEPEFAGASDDDLAQAMMGGLAIALIPWLIGMWFTHQVLYWLACAARYVFRYVWDPPRNEVAKR